jgi:cell division septal protein FtsQ
MDTIDKVLLREDLDSEEESLYTRRRKGVTVRRRRFASLRRGLRFASWAVVVLVPLAVAGYCLGPFLANSSLFRLDPTKDVEIDGNHFVPREEIINALAIPSIDSLRGAEANLFQLSLDDKRRRVESISWVRSAVLSRVYPHGLVVHVVERTPVAFANVGGRIELVDSDGTLLDKPEKAFFDFPIIAGLDSVSGVPDRKSRMALFHTFSEQLAGELPRSGWLISEVDLADAVDLKALLVQGQETILVHFGYEAFAERFHNLLTSLPELRKTNAKIDSVDLRYRNQIVVNPSGGRQQEAGERMF